MSSYVTKNYDEACEDLARKFLGDDPSDEAVAALAATIQNAVEQWFQEMETQ